MKHSQKPLFNREEQLIRPGLFSVFSIIPQIIICAIVFGAYYYIVQQGYFPFWINYIYYAVKIIIALQIMIGAARSLIMPLLAIILGGLDLYMIQMQGTSLISGHDAWQLIIIGAIGIILTFIVRSLRH